MERRIYEAAAEGRVDSLLQLLQEDALLLDRIMASCCSETPLHVASMLGHVNFVQEIITRKPELAGELDSRKSSPLHLATAKGYLDVVKILVSVNPEMCFVRDRDGRNPLHIAAIKGHVNVLRELVQLRPQAARILMNRGETILHACVRYNQLEAMKLLFETLGDHEFVNYKNDDGNTILHLAVAEKQIEDIKFLITSTAIEVNALNANGLTASDTLLPDIKGADEKDSEIIELLRRVSSSSAINAKEIGKKKKKDNKAPKSQDDHHAWLRKKRNTLMVVASLTATMAFQLGANPPGGLWQDSGDDKTAAAAPPRTAGTSIFADLSPKEYAVFVSFNTVSFVASLSIIFLLVSGLPFRSRILMWVLMIIMWVAITTIAVTYLLSIFALAPDNAWKENTFSLALGYGILAWLGLIMVVALGHAIRLLVRMIKFISKSLTRRRQRRSSSPSSSSRSKMMVNHNAAPNNLDNLNNV